MHSLINEIAKQLNLPPAEAEKALSDLLIRIRAGLETIGEAEVEGIGTFRSVDGQITFEPTGRLTEEINKEFAGMKPVALTATGESVDPTDRRALPGVDPGSGDVVEEPQTVAAGPDERPQVGETVPSVEEEAKTEGEVEESEFAKGFESPPPPFPSKIRVPLSERRASRSSGGGKTQEGIPDMGSVVSTRPVEPIKGGIPRRRKSKAPVYVTAAVVVVGLASWAFFGGGESVPPPETDLAVATPVESQGGASSRAASVDRVASNPSAVVDPVAQASVANQEMEAETEENAEEYGEGIGAEESEEWVLDDSEEVDEQAGIQSTPDVVESEPVENEPATTTAPISGATFSWIVASYPSMDEAERRAGLMRESGFDANVYEATVRGQPAFRVGIGQFESESTALDNRGLVPADITDAWITRVK